MIAQAGDLVSVTKSTYGTTQTGRVLAREKVEGKLDMYTVQQHDGIHAGLTLEDIVLQIFTPGASVEVLTHDGAWEQTTLVKLGSSGKWEVCRTVDGKREIVDELKIRLQTLDCHAYDNPTCDRMAQHAGIAKGSFRIFDQWPALHIEASTLFKLDLAILNSPAFTDYWNCVYKNIIAALPCTRTVWIGGQEVKAFQEGQGVTFAVMQQATTTQEHRVQTALKDNKGRVVVQSWHPTCMVRNLVSAQQAFYCCQLWVGAAKNPNRVHDYMDQATEGARQNVEQMRAEVTNLGWDVDGLLEKRPSLLHTPVAAFVTAHTLISNISMERSVTLDKDHNCHLSLRLAKSDMQKFAANWRSTGEVAEDLHIDSPTRLYEILKTCIRCADRGLSLATLWQQLRTNDIDANLWISAVAKVKYAFRIQQMCTTINRLMEDQFAQDGIARIISRASKLAVSDEFENVYRKLKGRHFKEQQITTILANVPLSILKSGAEMALVLKRLAKRHFTEEQMVTILSRAATLVASDHFDEVFDQLQTEGYNLAQITTILGMVPLSILQSADLALVLRRLAERHFTEEQRVTILSRAATLVASNHFGKVFDQFEENGFARTHITTMFGQSAKWLLLHDELDMVIKCLLKDCLLKELPQIARMDEIAKMISKNKTRASAEKFISSVLDAPTALESQAQVPTQHMNHQDMQGPDTQQARGKKRGGTEEPGDVSHNVKKRVKSVPNAPPAQQSGAQISQGPLQFPHWGALQSLLALLQQQQLAPPPRAVEPHPPPPPPPPSLRKNEEK